MVLSYCYELIFQTARLLAAQPSLHADFPGKFTDIPASP
jgi:hypothetical protein